jgi:16S rRNA (adenine1518-N6/adenine1519-N6)-dimethyltransferase
MDKRRALGQHYLVDPSVVQLIIGCADIKRNERVLEIGTGRGILTKRLCKLSKLVEGFELDEANYLETKRHVEGGVIMHLGDAFSTDSSFDVLVSSLPYSESGTFVEWLSQRRYDRAIVLLQKEFAEKLMSPPGLRSYRAMSVIFQMSSTIEVVGRIGRAAFAPPPRVSSALVVIRPLRTLDSLQVKYVKRLFSQKKRRLGVALKNLGLGTKGVPLEYLSRRVWNLTVPEVAKLLDAMS